MVLQRSGARSAAISRPGPRSLQRSRNNRNPRFSLLQSRGTRHVKPLAKPAKGPPWIAANVSAMPGMLEDIIERTKEAADSYLSQPHARINGVQIGPVGIDWTYAQEAQGNWRTRMNGVFRQLEKHDVGLLSKRPIASFPIKTLSFCSRCCPILAPAGSRR